ncbi:MAG: uroporphyrinogen decarboxylase family protein [Bryobacteraceae bacterium]
MTSREIVQRTIDFEDPPRLAFDYYAYGSRFTDIVTSYLDWEFVYDARTWIEGDREYCLDPYGNTWVRHVNDPGSKGLPCRGVLEKSWEGLASFTMPKFSAAAGNDNVRRLFQSYPDLFKVGCLYNAAFSILCCLRGFENLMQDVLAEPAAVREACGLIDRELVDVVHSYAACGADGLHIMEDLGTQTTTLIRPAVWEKLFAPGYERLCRAAHEHGMRVILHSCGAIRSLIPLLIDCGIDVLQFDQTHNYGSPEASGIERLAAEFHGRVAFFCPVDIQRTLVTGDRGQIEDETRRLVHCLGGRRGGFIAKSYGRGAGVYLDAINCAPEWNDFAFECFRKHGEELFGAPIDLPRLDAERPRSPWAPAPGARR